MFLARVREDKSRAASELNYGHQRGFFWEGKADRSHNILINKEIYGLDGGERGIL